MTNKEAISIITQIKGLITNDNSWSDEAKVATKEAFELAIKALMAYRDCRHCTHNIKIGNMRGCELWDCDFEDLREVQTHDD